MCKCVKLLQINLNEYFFNDISNPAAMVLSGRLRFYSMFPSSEWEWERELLYRQGNITIDRFVSRQNILSRKTKLKLEECVVN